MYDYLNPCVSDEMRLFQIEEAIIMSKIIHFDNENLIRNFASAFNIEFYEESEIIIKQNEIGTHFYLILEGIVEVAQEKVDFLYFDYTKKNKFMELMQSISTQRKRDQKQNNTRAVLKTDDIIKLREELLMMSNNI